MRRLVKQQVSVIIWMCSDGPSTMVALTRSTGAPEKVSKSLDWLEPPNHRLCSTTFHFPLCCCIFTSETPRAQFPFFGLRSQSQSRRRGERAKRREEEEKRREESIDYSERGGEKRRGEKKKMLNGYITQRGIIFMLLKLQRPCTRSSHRQGSSLCCTGQADPVKTGTPVTYLKQRT